MKITFVVLFGILAILFSSGAWMVGSYYAAYEYGVDSETQIETRYQNMENILGQYGLKVKEVAQVPDMAADDLSRVVREGMTGRYGENGSQATFQWIQENYPGQVDPSLYKQIQQVMEAGRNEFKNEQTLFLDVKRLYVTTLKNDLPLTKGWWLKIAGFPKIHLDEYAIISTSRAKNAFDTKMDEAIQIR